LKLEKAASFEKPSESERSTFNAQRSTVAVSLCKTRR
jgi:hypothetical protein